MPRQLMPQSCSRWCRFKEEHVVSSHLFIYFGSQCVVQMDGRMIVNRWRKGSLYLEDDILQVLSVLLDDLLNEVRVSGAQVRRRRLVQLKLKPPPQVWRVKDVVPAAAHRRDPGAVHQGQMLEDLQHHVVRQVAPVLGWSASLCPLVSLDLVLLREGLARGLEICPSSLHSESSRVRDAGTLSDERFSLESLERIKAQAPLREKYLNVFKPTLHIGCKFIFK